MEEPQNEDILDEGIQNPQDLADFGRYFSLAEDDRLVDQGKFIASLNGQIVAQEQFAVIRRAKRGIFKRKGGGLSLATHFSRPDGSLSLETSWTFDRTLCPLKTEAHTVAAANPASSFGSHPTHGWDSRISIKGDKARLAIKGGARPVDMRLAYRRDWLINMGPSLMPLYILLGRYNMKQGGVQDFTALSYSAADDNIALGRHMLEIEYLDPIPATDPQGDSLTLHYFVADLVPLAGKARTKAPPMRRYHLWMDDGRRLRKVVDAEAGILLTWDRAEDGTAYSRITPYQDMLWADDPSGNTANSTAQDAP